MRCTLCDLPVLLGPHADMEMELGMFPAQLPNSSQATHGIWLFSFRAHLGLGRRAEPTHCLPCVTQADGGSTQLAVGCRKCLFYGAFGCNVQTISVVIAE